MATIRPTLTAPDAAVPRIRKTLGWRLGKTPPATAAELEADIAAYLKLCLKDDATQMKLQEALAAAQADDSDGLVSW